MAKVDFLFDGAHIVQGLVPVADAFAGGVSTDVVSLKDYNRVTFVIVTGAIEDAGVSNVVKVQACDNTTPSTTTDMSFYRNSLQWSTTVDTWGALALAPSTGYNFTVNNAVANAVHIATVTGDMVNAAAPGNAYVRLNIAETVNKTITATVLVILSEPRYPQAIPVTAIA
jgi:hypothetical protein